MRISSTRTVVAALLLGRSMGAGALGLGPERVVAVLGQPLEVVLPLHVEPADATGSDCVEAEVAFGDERLPASQVRVRVEAGTAGSTERRVHVSTVPVVTEPVVSVVVKAGCRGEVAKKLVAFADPPAADEAASSAAAVLLQKPRKEKAPASEPVAPAAPSRAARSPLPSKVAPPSRQAARPDPVALSGVQKEKGAQQRRQTLAARPPATAAQRRPSVPGSARLTLEPVERSGPPRPEPEAASPPLAQAVPALAPAVPPAPPAPASAQPPAEAARVQALEQTLTELRRELALTRQSLDAMERRSVQAEAPAMREAPLPVPPAAPTPAWVHLLAAIAAMLAATTGWLLLQMRRDRMRETWAMAPLPEERPSRQESAPVPRAAADLFPPPPASPQGAPAFPVTPAPAGAVSPETSPPAPSPLPARALGAARPARSPLEDLLDLDQQVEFFIALGQETVAVGLLQSVIDEDRIRSPLPWLMLMALHQCLEDRPAFERVRTCFAERFSVDGPGWETDLRQGRVLDDCPELVEPLERLWPTPQAAVTLLEALLLQIDERAGRLELPVCLDLLLLYSLLRERPELKAQAEASVLDPAPPPSSARAAAAAAARTPDWPPPFPGTVPSDAPLETIEFEPLQFDPPFALGGGGTRAP